ncbi:fibronectin type III domain-containing protein [Candidatus Halobeggiatoa sp. HSG11]|nr:fibronectin type III domain-containing protein [Candidatus Halobeggiatoa sp. HSG11]
MKNNIFYLGIYLLIIVFSITSCEMKRDDESTEESDDSVEVQPQTSPAPVFPGINEIIPTNTDTVDITWESATDDLTQADNILYKIYLSKEANFTPNQVTRHLSILGENAAEITGLETGTTYYILIIAMDNDGNQSVERDYRWTTTFFATPSELENDDSLIIAKINDLQSNLASIAINNKRQKIIAVFGNKDSNGDLKDITDIAYIPIATPDRAINIDLSDDNPIIEFSDGKKIEITNYDSEKKLADLILTENGETEKTNELKKQYLDIVPQNTCLDSSGEFGDIVADCLLRWSLTTVDQIMGMACNVMPTLMTFPLEVLGMEKAFCSPFDTDIEVNCYTAPINNAIDIVEVPANVLGAMECKNALKCVNQLFNLGLFAKHKNSTTSSCNELDYSQDSDVVIDDTDGLAFVLTCNGNKTCTIPYKGTANLKLDYYNVVGSGTVEFTGDGYLRTGYAGYKINVPAGNGTINFTITNTPLFRCWEVEANPWIVLEDDNNQVLNYFNGKKESQATFKLLGIEDDPWVPCNWKVTAEP